VYNIGYENSIRRLLMEGIVIALVVIISVLLLGGVAYLIYNDIRKRRAAFQARAAEAASREREEEVSRERAGPQTEEEIKNFLISDTEKRRQNTLRVKLATYEFPESEDVDFLISELQVTRLCVQNLTAQKLEQEAIKDLKVFLGTVKARESLLRGKSPQKD